jgi:RHS repeat-associated protein
MNLSTTSTAGPSQTDYGYTGEFTANDMVYLRARQYAPGMGRFLTRDTWSGDVDNPLSMNRWGYVEGNPVNLSDPSGYSPVCGCVKAIPSIPDWWKNRSHIYLEGYGYFDAQHLDRGWRSAKWIEDNINALGQGGGNITLTSNEYWAIYKIHPNVNNFNRVKKIGVMYGIYTDFEVGYEKYQDYRISKFRFPSAFSPEDLPSDHLGFWAYVNGYKKGDIPNLLECLGEVTDRGNDFLKSYIIDRSYESNDGRLIPGNRDILPMVYGGGYYHFSVPRNYKFLPMITDRIQYEDGKLGTQSRNIAWPSSRFAIQSVASGPTTWQKVTEGYN